MKVFALGDLHLSGKQNKPMDVFGERWANHRERIFGAWQQTVGDGDCVLLPGDFCWAMQLNDALDDLFAVSELPGTKILLRGNHDYWWASPTKMRDLLPPSMKIIQNDAADMGEFVVCGSRGWLLPGSADFRAEDEKIHKRELMRLEMSLNAAVRLARPEDGPEKPIIVMMHYPPLTENGESTGFSELIERFPVFSVVYGHLHAQSCRLAFEGEHGGVNYSLCSADHLGFCPKLIAEFGETSDPA